MHAFLVPAIDLMVSLVFYLIPFAVLLFDSGVENWILIILFGLYLTTTFF